MARLNQVNIKQEEDDAQKEVSVDNEENQQNSKGTLSRHDNTSHSNIYIKQEFDDEHKEVKNIAQQQFSVRRCTKVKKEEEGGECKVEWDGNECDCDQCRVEREVKIEFSQNNATNNQQANSCGPSQANKVRLCKRVKKEEDESAKLKDDWDEDCDCDDCRRMKLKAIRLKQTNVVQNGGTGGDDGEETEIDEGVLVGNDTNIAVDDQIGNEDGDELNQKNQQSEDGQESSEGKISDGDDETEIDDEEYEMEVDDDEISNKSTTNPIQPNRHLQCPHCHKSFDFRCNYQRHLRVHTGERPFQCDQCDERFKEKNKLTRHQQIHQNIKLFRCLECEKQFTRKDCLDTHLLMHSGERPFKYRHCKKCFTTMGTRTNHEQAIHLHVKPYRCKQCGHTATQIATIITHIRIVHFGLPRSTKEQRALNIVDERDPRELFEKV